MSKKVILALLALIIACCICFVAAGIAFYFFFSEDMFSSSTNEQILGQSVNNTPIPTEIVVLPTIESQTTEDFRITYLKELNEDLLYCVDLYNAWGNINQEFANDMSLLDNADAVEEYKLSLTQLKENCTSFGINENPPPSLENINNECLLINESANIFIDNFLIYLDTKDEAYGETGITGAFDMLDHMEQLLISIQDLNIEE